MVRLLITSEGRALCRTMRLLHIIADPVALSAGCE